MNKILKYLSALFFSLTVLFIGCQEDEYSLGDLTAPSGIVINTEIIGSNTANPNGDGSGDVKITVTATNALAYKIDFGTTTTLNLVPLIDGKVTRKFTTTGVNTYRLTVVTYGKGGSSAILTKNITVRSDFNPAPALVTALTNNNSKTWIVDKSVPGHFGVGPWNVGSVRPEWWAAAIDEKVNCCNCFYTARFTFTKVVATNTYTLTVATPDGAFTKTGALAGGLPGIPASGAEGCYPYAGGTSAFTFGPATSGVPAIGTTPNSNSTQTSINLAGVNTFIGYGALQKEYEILEITPTYMYLRIRGTETGNTWYLKMIPAP